MASEVKQCNRRLRVDQICHILLAKMFNLRLYRTEDCLHIVYLHVLDHVLVFVSSLLRCAVAHMNEFNSPRS